MFGNNSSFLKIMYKNRYNKNEWTYNIFVEGLYVMMYVVNTLCVCAIISRLRYDDCKPLNNAGVAQW